MHPIPDIASGPLKGLASATQLGMTWESGIIGTFHACSQLQTPGRVV